MYRERVDSLAVVIRGLPTVACGVVLFCLSPMAGAWGLGLSAAGQDLFLPGRGGGCKARSWPCCPRLGLVVACDDRPWRCPDPRPRRPTAPCRPAVSPPSPWRARRRRRCWLLLGLGLSGVVVRARDAARPLDGVTVRAYAPQPRLTGLDLSLPRGRCREEQGSRPRNVPHVLLLHVFVCSPRLGAGPCSVRGCLWLCSLLGFVIVVRVWVQGCRVFVVRCRWRDGVGLPRWVRGGRLYQ